MADRISPFARFRRLPRDSAAKTILVVLSVSLACSIVVASTAVYLRPLHEANRLKERESHFQALVAGLRDDGSAGGKRRVVTARVVDLASGAFDDTIDPDRFDSRAAAQDPERSMALPSDRDPARIRRRPGHAVVYLVRENGRRRQIILPVYGRGYGSTLHGYLGLSGDTETVVGLAFYRHRETPGLGALIDAPPWRAQWRGKRVWGDDGKPKLGVARGAIDPASPEARFQVDAITGATWTGQGVTNLLQFWLGDDGFGPFLRRLRGQGN